MGYYFVGLDLGQSNDFTALAIVEREGENLRVRHLQRFALGTVYPTIAKEVSAIMAHLPGARLVVDSTGVGRPVIDLLREARLAPIAVTITAGDTETNDNHEWRVPKRDLVSAIAVGLQTERLKVAVTLPDAATLIREMLAFKVNINLAAGPDSYEGWRERDHDDLVLAVALAVWSAGKFYSPPIVLRHRPKQRIKIPGLRMDTKPPKGLSRNHNFW